MQQFKTPHLYYNGIVNFFPSLQLSEVNHSFLIYENIIHNLHFPLILIYENI
jgi:hypothetical protein